MAEHYYTAEPSSPHHERTFSLEIGGQAFTFTTDAGVFSKDGLDAGTALLLAALPDAFSGRALDLGCGWGAVGTVMAARWPQAQISLCDVNARAVHLAQENIRRNGLCAQVYCGDGPGAAPGLFDLIAVNPAHPCGQGRRIRSFCTERAAARCGRTVVRGHAAQTGSGFRGKGTCARGLKACKSLSEAVDIAFSWRRKRGMHCKTTWEMI